MLEKCESCGDLELLRPWGPHGEHECFACLMAPRWPHWLRNWWLGPLVKQTYMGGFEPRGFYAHCGCCGHEAHNVVGARWWVAHMAGQTYYGARILPEVSYGMAKDALEYLEQIQGEPHVTLDQWVERYYPGDELQKATALGWIMGLDFSHVGKSPDYQAWRDRHKG